MISEITENNEQHLSEIIKLKDQLVKMKKSSGEKDLNTCNYKKKIGSMLSKFPSNLWVNLLFC